MKLLNHTHHELRERLNFYLSDDANFKIIFEHCRRRFKDSGLTAHNWEHVYRDTINALVIGESEEANMQIVLTATVAHDIGFLYGAIGKNHGEVGAENFAKFLEESGATFSQTQIDEISECIRTHKGSTHGIVPKSLEGKVVADADLMEKFGPFGVYQNIRTMTEFNRNFKDSTKRFIEIDELEMFTETGRQLASNQARLFVKEFFSALIEAGEPYGDIS